MEKKKVPEFRDYVMKDGKKIKLYPMTRNYMYYRDEHGWLLVMPGYHKTDAFDVVTRKQCRRYGRLNEPYKARYWRLDRFNVAWVYRHKTGYCQRCARFLSGIKVFDYMPEKSYLDEKGTVDIYPDGTVFADSRQVDALAGGY